MEYQTYTPRLKIRRPLIFEDYLTLERDDKAYKLRNGPGLCKNFAPGHMGAQKELYYKPYQAKSPGLKSHRLEFAIELVEPGKTGIKIRNVNQKLTFCKYNEDVY